MTPSVLTHIKRTALRKKILLSMAFLLLLLGFFVWLTVEAFVIERSRETFSQEGTKHAQSLALSSTADMLTQNYTRLQKLIESVKTSETNMAYIFVVDASGHVLVHTFSQGFPVALMNANSVTVADNFKTQLLDTNTLGFIYDIAVPIRLDKSMLGQVRIGVSEAGVRRELASLHRIMLTTTLVFVVFGIGLAFPLSGFITKPLSQLVGGIEAVKRGDFSAKVNVRSSDEIGLLAGAFNEMIDRLNLLVSKEATLAKSRERERIALNFHDGCAQDLVSLLKRIELCEKLIEIKSAEASTEFGLLKDYTKNILDRARKMIFDLKSKEDRETPLLERIRSYLEDYGKTSDIAVELTVSGSPDSLLPVESEQLFHVITEALCNVRKHSAAHKATVAITAGPRALLVTIRDNGRGFDVVAENVNDPRRGKFGLLAMRQRAKALGARLDIRSDAVRGTEVALELPMNHRGGKD